MKKEELEVEFLKGNPLPDVENTHGAHYYVFSDGLGTISSSGPYDEAMVHVTLPSVNVGKNTSYPRTAFISLGIGSYGIEGKTVDIGIANTGDGWYPVIYDGQHINPDGTKGLMHAYTDFIVKPEDGATHAIIVAAAKNPTKVRINVIFQDDYGNTVGKTCWKEEIVTYTDWSRFHRFASLMNNNENPSDDGTYMKEGQFTSALLHHKTLGYIPWGIWTDMVTNFWIVGPALCKVTNETDTGETFNIINNGG